MPRLRLINAYRVLGIPRDADPEEIRAAYRRLAAQNHPDRTGNDPSATRHFLRIQRANQILNDLDLRRELDLALAKADQRSAATPEPNAEPTPAADQTTADRWSARESAQTTPSYSKPYRMTPSTAGPKARERRESKGATAEPDWPEEWSWGSRNWNENATGPTPEDRARWQVAALKLKYDDVMWLASIFVGMVFAALVFAFWAVNGMSDVNFLSILFIMGIGGVLTGWMAWALSGAVSAGYFAAIRSGRRLLGIKRLDDY